MKSRALQFSLSPPFALLVVGALLFFTPSPAAAKAGLEAKKVKILSSGSAPKAMLRYRIKEGLKVRYIGSVRLKMETGDGTTVVAQVEQPTIRSTGQIVATKVFEDGRIRLEYQYESVEVVTDDKTPPEMLEQMREELAVMESVSGWVMTNDRGIWLDGGVNTKSINSPVAEQLLNSLEKGLAQMLIPLPKRAVGKGARWQQEIKNVIPELSDLPVTTTNVYHLLDEPSDEFRTRLAMSQSAPRQRVKPPELPTGAKADLLAMYAVGEGTSTSDLGSLIPTSRMWLKINTKMRVYHLGKVQNVETEQVIESTLRATK